MNDLIELPPGMDSDHFMEALAQNAQPGTQFVVYEDRPFERLQRNIIDGVIALALIPLGATLLYLASALAYLVISNIHKSLTG